MTGRKRPWPAVPFAEWSQADQTTWISHPVVGGWTPTFRAEVTRAYGAFLGFRSCGANGTARLADALVAYGQALETHLAPTSAEKGLQLTGYALLVIDPDPAHGQLALDLYRQTRAKRLPPGSGPAAPNAVREPLSLPYSNWGPEDQARWTRAVEPPRSSLTDRFRRRAHRVASAPIAAAPSDEAFADVPESKRPPWTWSEAYKARVQRGWGRYLGWAAASGHNGGPVIRAAIEAFVDDCWQRPGCTSVVSVATYLFEVYRALTVMHPDQDWTWLKEDWIAVKQYAAPVKDKASRYVPVDELYHFAVELMDTALRRLPTAFSALLFRDGYMLALLCLRPKRLRNIASIRVGEQLLLGADGMAETLVFATTKNGDPSQVPFPDALQSYHAAWWSRFRPVLLGTVEDHGNLWIGRDGRPLGHHQFWRQLTLHTMRRFGRAVGPHMIRTCYATSHANADTTRMPLVQHQLDQRDPRSAEAYLVGGRSGAASRMLNDALEALRQRRGLPRPRRMAPRWRVAER